MKKSFLIAVVMLMTVGCGTKYNYYDSGKVQILFDGTMLEYFHCKPPMDQPQNWDSIIKLADRAGLTEMFQRENITFMGVTNYTIARWLDRDGDGFKNYGYKKIADIPVNMCEAIILNHVIDGKLLRDDIERATFDEKGNFNGGGRKLTTRGGKQVILYTQQVPYLGMPGVGPITIFMRTLMADGVSAEKTTTIGCGDIQPHNGVVHALEYSYNITGI